METCLVGKIHKAEFGFIPGHEYLMGLQLTFKLEENSYISDAGQSSRNISKTTQWDSTMEQLSAYSFIILHVRDILEKAEVHYISELVGKLVKVYLTEGDVFNRFEFVSWED